MRPSKERVRKLNPRGTEAVLGEYPCGVGGRRFPGVVAISKSADLAAVNQKAEKTRSG
jgi:hypothetical protein